MLRNVLPSCVTMLGLVLLLCGVRSGIGAPLANETLDLYSGGVDQWCVLNPQDPNGLSCNQCVSNGNGGWVNCDTNGVDQYAQYQKGQSPALNYVWSSASCGGTATHWTSSTCAKGTDEKTEPCNRTIDIWTYNIKSLDVKCP